MPDQAEPPLVGPQPWQPPADLVLRRLRRWCQEQPRGIRRQAVERLISAANASATRGSGDRSGSCASRKNGFFKLREVGA